jgi:hypothetical protein
MTSADRDILLTGTPRSGTTLACHLLNELPAVVALHEPMRVRDFAAMADHAEVVDAVARFCAEQRASIVNHGRATSKQAEGRVPDNPYGSVRAESGLRQRVVRKGEVGIDKPLPPDFALVVKHISAFTAVLGALVGRFPVHAVVRNPLANLASWNSIEFDLRQGRVPAAEALDPALTARLDGIPDPIDRQIALLDWFHGQFLRHLPASSILRYEDIVETGGAALAIVHPDAASLDEPLASRNANRLYDRRLVEQLGERLLASDGAYWELYGRASVVRLLADMLCDSGEYPEATGENAEAGPA